MKVAIIGTVGVPACYGGYETLVENMLTYKTRDDIVYQVYCSAKTYKDRIEEYKGAKLKYIPLNANGPSAILYDSISLVHAYFTCDIILSLGTVGSFVLPIMKLFSNKRFIVNLDGLDNKRAKFNSFSQTVIGAARWIAAKLADTRISDNQGIKYYAQTKYNRDSELIEYGGDNACRLVDDEKLLNRYNLHRGEYIFKVARIEPENNIELILQALSEIPEEKMVIVGNWNKSEFGRTIRKKYESYSNMMLLDSIYESSEINLLRSNCKLYIHGHSAGGTNPSLVEAMNLELPIIAFDVIYNRETTEHKAQYFSDKDTLKTIILNLSKDKSARDALGEKMSEIAKRRYTWEIICQKYESLF